MESSRAAHVLRTLHMEMERCVIVWKARIIHLLFNIMLIIQGIFKQINSYPPNVELKQYFNQTKK